MSQSEISFDPGRTFVTLKHGPFKGRWEVFHSIDDFRRYYPNEPVVVPWHTAKKGDWVLTDDGKVCQILKEYWLGDPSRRKRLTHVFRVAWSSVPYYERRDGTSSSIMVFQLKRRRNPSSMASDSTRRHGKHWNSKKNHFAWLVLVRGMEPYRAYMAAFSCISLSTAKAESHYLMKEDRLMKDIATIYKELLDANGLDQEDIAKEVASLVKGSKGRTKIDAIKLALELRGEYAAGTNVNVKFPQLPASNPSVAGARSLKAPPAQLPAPALPPAEIEAEDEPDMEEAHVVEDQRLIENTEQFRLPNGEIQATGNTSFLEMNYAKQLNKLQWFRKYHGVKRLRIRRMKKGELSSPPKKPMGFRVDE